MSPVLWIGNRWRLSYAVGPARLCLVSLSFVPWDWASPRFKIARRKIGLWARPFFGCFNDEFFLGGTLLGVTVSHLQRSRNSKYQQRRCGPSRLAKRATMRSIAGRYFAERVAEAWRAMTGRTVDPNLRENTRKST